MSDGSSKLQNLERGAASQVRKHQFIVMIVGSVLIAFFMVFVALSLYVSSGTIQLDLSRPGFAQARKEAQNRNEVFRGFSPDGPINEASLKEFEKLYDDRMKEATAIEAFSGDALSNKTLRLE